MGFVAIILLAGLIAGLTSRGADTTSRSFLVLAGFLWTSAIALFTGRVLGGLSEDALFLCAMFLLMAPGLLLFVAGTQRSEQAGFMTALEPTVGAVLPDAEFTPTSGDRVMAGSFDGYPVTVTMSARSPEGRSAPNYVVSLKTDNPGGQHWRVTCECKRFRRPECRCPTGRVRTGDSELEQRLVTAGVLEILRGWPPDVALRCDAEQAHPIILNNWIKGVDALEYHVPVNDDLPQRMTPNQFKAQLELLVRLVGIDQRVNRYAGR